MQISLRKLLPIPIVIFIFSVAVLFYNFFTTGDFVLRDIDLKGGTLVSVESDAPLDTRLIEERLGAKYGSIFASGLRTATGFGANIEIPAEANTTELISDLENMGIGVKAFSVESIGPSLGNLFLQQVRDLLIAAFILMSVVIFIVYRKLVSSFAIVFAAVANILTTLAITSLLGIKISFAGFAGLLMLIAYTVDTNIVLTTKVIRTTPEEFRKKYRLALITGLTLIATISITMSAVVLISTSKLLINVAEVLVVGFIFDLPFTWILNAGLLESYIGRRKLL